MNNKSLKVYHTNCRSLRNKFKELVSLVLVHDYDIVCITESWVSEKFNRDLLHEYELQGYKNYFYQREDRQGGGVILYVRDSFTCRNVHGVKELDACVESVWLDLSTIDNICFRIGLFYRSPCPPIGLGANYVKSLNKKYIDELNRGVKSAANNVVLVLGDFNYSDVDWNLMHATDECSIEFIDFVHDNFLEQVVHEHTRGNNILDIVCTNHSSIISNMQVIAPLGNSDHSSLSFDIDINIKNTANNKKVYNYKKGNFDKLRVLLSEIDWESKFRDKNCSEMWEIFKENIKNIQDECIPKVTARSGTFKHKPSWWSDEIGSLIKEKHKANKKLVQNGFIDRDLENFRKIRDKVKSTIRKQGIQDDILIGNEKNPRKLFRKYKVKSKVKEHINFIKKGNQIFSGDKNIADGFNSFFSSIFTKDEKYVDIDLLEDEMVGNVNSISSLEISRDTVYKIIRSLDVNKSMGPDNISSRILKEGVDSISLALTIIFNKSLSDANVHEDWKMANVVPIFKKGDKELVDNYRPISLTSVVVRILEKAIKHELVEFLNRYKLIVRSQHGFTNKKSCLTNLLEYLEYVTEIIDAGNSADVVYLDFSKAFDKVSHNKLVSSSSSSS